MEIMKMPEIVDACNNVVSQIKPSKKKNKNLYLMIFIAIFSIIYLLALFLMLFFAKTSFISANSIFLYFALIIALMVPLVCMIKLYGNCLKTDDTELNEIEGERYRKAMLDRYIKQMDLIIEEYRLGLEQLRLELRDKNSGNNK